MSDELAEFEAGDLLHEFGEVRMPERHVLDHAREVLRSAIADEMLGVGAAGEQATPTGGSAGRGSVRSEEDRRKKTQRRHTDLSRGERRMSTGGGDS